MSWVILQELAGKQVVVKLNSKPKIGKSFVKLTPNLEFNRLYEVHKDLISPYTESRSEVAELTGGNSAYFDSNTAQTLTHDEIQAIKNEKGGQHLIEELVHNSKTFGEKTQYSQAKYLKRKKERHLGVFQLFAPTAALLADTLYKQKPSASIRSDALFNLIMLGNVHSDSRVVVIDEINGTVLGAVLERTASHVQCLRNKHKALKYFPRKECEFVDRDNFQGEFDFAVLGCRENLAGSFSTVIPLVVPSGSLAAFTWDLGAAATAYEMLIGMADVGNVALEEIWTREFQVLVNRTHPVMNESGIGTSGGYLVSATKLVSS